MKTSKMDLRLKLIVPIGALLLASGIGVGLVGLRILYTGNWRQLYLVGNLFLAWLPLVFSIIAWRLAHRGALRNWRFYSAASAWLAFFPNAPYIFTDLIHLRAWPRGRYWVDLVLILLFALTAFLIGFVSLYLMHSLVRRLLGTLAGWLFVPLIAGLTGLGICIGRFLRWNSWDLLLNPFGICRDLFERAGQIFVHPGSIVLPSLFGIFFLVAYLMLYALTCLPALERYPESNLATLSEENRTLN